MSTVSVTIKEEAEAKKQAELIDYKMVTFSLGGKDYGIDIMKVKEIAKDSEFTYVPNTPAYVRGVYNLRGDIISIIDLRLMFNLYVEKKKEGEPENMIILRLSNNILGVIVDSTDKVVGVSSENIQPPHPLFGDINIKYISGVVEHNNRLYIILDVERIFGGEEELPEEREEKAEVEEVPGYPIPSEEKEELDLNFIADTLATFKGFYVTPVNYDWVKSRFDEWKGYRKTRNEDIQLRTPEEADEFLLSFYSPYTEELLGDDFLDEIKKILPKFESKTLSVWNPGCGKGFESYSMACLLKTLYPESRIKIWANDKDLLNITSAPNLIFQPENVPESLKIFLAEGRNGYQFKSEIKDLILFEFHDILNQNPFPDVDIIIARDVLSFLPLQDQEKLIKELEQKLKPNGILIIGNNERLTEYNWIPVEEAKISAYKRKLEE
ncbi:MAG: chemotaxis protein CheR [Spirochaetes bacterium]|nr:MAG: chemotaxis protein CheR [Spirochaetota bacterium]